VFTIHRALLRRVLAEPLFVRDGEHGDDEVQHLVGVAAMHQLVEQLELVRAEGNFFHLS